MKRDIGQTHEQRIAEIMIHHRIKAWPTWLRQLVWASSRSRPPLQSWQTSPESAQDDIQEEALRAFASIPGELVFDHLSSAEHGVSDTEAFARRRIYGRNVVSPQSPPSCFILFLSIILNSFGILLIFLAIINTALTPPTWVKNIRRSHYYGLDLVRRAALV
ncbi:hypothetical protein CDV31_010701 [Fusarium ambrosium]|uniref:Cation-transporting P-type ATPase N-terminal domain-containing protein n=1 Tax=Fusarium ambrosium TaxID=131363 RepID=A0A428TLM5_9HYPO|nr:hypothetical protein CDV31_010701 [Fusarium ambrosium]